MKLLIDMNLSPRWVTLLGNSGIQAKHWTEVGDPTASDRELVQYALENGYVILTHDLDFSAILAATGAEKPSVVQIRSTDVSPDFIGGQVLSALHQVENEIIQGALISLDISGLRIRILPISTPR